MLSSGSKKQSGSWSLLKGSTSWTNWKDERRLALEPCIGSIGQLQCGRGRGGMIRAQHFPCATAARTTHKNRLQKAVDGGQA